MYNNAHNLWLDRGVSLIIYSKIAFISQRPLTAIVVPEAVVVVERLRDGVEIEGVLERLIVVGIFLVHARGVAERVLVAHFPTREMEARERWTDLFLAQICRERNGHCVTDEVQNE